MTTEEIRKKCHETVTAIAGDWIDTEEPLSAALDSLEIAELEIDLEEAFEFEADTLRGKITGDLNLDYLVKVIESRFK